MKVKVINKSNNDLPVKTHKTDCCIDLRASFVNINQETLKGDHCAFDEKEKAIIIWSGGTALIGTGLYLSLPEGYELQIRSRSGLALKNHVSVCNSPGCIDQGYRSEIGVILQNMGNEPFYVYEGDRIAQASLAKVYNIEWDEVTKLDTSDRGTTGFGDSGIK